MHKEINIIFTDGGKLISKLIKWKSWGSWSHCAAVFTDRKTQPYLIDAAFPDGVRVRRYRELVCKSRRQRMITIQVTAVEHDKFKNFLITKLGDAYGTQLFLGHILRSARFEKADEWVCSELLAAALREAGLLNLTDKEITRITPAGLERLIRNLANASSVDLQE